MMQIAEIFGHGYEDRSSKAQLDRAGKICPFRASPCTKSNKTDPLGVCTLSNGELATALCPVRFLERDKIFIDVANIAFGPGVQFAVFPEIRILKIEGGDDADKKIGKVDFLLGRLSDGVVTDFSAVEVQAVYFSGVSIRPSFQAYLEGKDLTDEEITRRPDFRSSAQKRLFPQLMLKVPVFRRWGKRFFVVVDSLFLGRLPPFRSVPSSNSELTWLGYPIQRNVSGGYSLQDPEVRHSLWDDVAFSLREGIAPERDEITAELQNKLTLGGPRRPRVLTS
jgi:hypothetical protein